ncbi:NfeD family protein [Planctomicrobium piriforme]|uniref:Membrane-bound serine protease (ClpP class) n=1 Tax=Planctomicrobium piriforme TaxID=1576369 RepID=A0A1I3CZD1_9PLAN|nr:NfeD family protein [Planctomicrobium piriforme]SFH79835.1 membrane-bound serine protease (ClpP class) [Planctomicrobium piriforme]
MAALLSAVTALGESEFMDPQLLVVVLVLAGIALIFAELFLPSGGAIAVMCIGCFLASGYFAYKAWYLTQPIFWWTYLGSVAVIIPATIIGAFQLLTRTSLGNRVLLSAPTSAEVTPYQQDLLHLTGLIGRHGTAVNLMTPGGLVLVNGERLHAVSEGLMIEPNTTVEVIAVRGTRVVVRPVAASTSAAELSQLAKEAEAAEDEIDPFRMDEA